MKNILSKFVVIEWRRMGGRFAPLVEVRIFGILIARKYWNPLNNLWMDELC